MVKPALAGETAGRVFAQDDFRILCHDLFGLIFLAADSLLVAYLTLMSTSGVHTLPFPVLRRHVSRHLLGPQGEACILTSVPDPVSSLVLP